MPSAQREAPTASAHYGGQGMLNCTLVYLTDEVLYSIRLSLRCLRFSQNRNVVETSNLLDI